MNKFLKNIIFFLAFFAVSMVVFIVLWSVIVPKKVPDNFHYGMKSNSFLYNRIKEAELTKDVDICFFGTSQTYRGIDPRIFKRYNLKIMNLGSSNQTPIQAEIEIDRYLKKLNPKAVVFEVNPEALSIKGVESSIDFNIHSKIDYYLLKQAILLNEPKTWISLIYCTYRQIFKLDANYQHPNKLTEDTYIKGGYVEKKYHPFYGKQYKDSVIWKSYKFQKNALERCINKLKKNGAKVYLVQMPIERSLYESTTEKSENCNYFKSFGLEFYNYSEILQMDSHLFLDNFHLNQKGVEIFNNALIKDLKLKQYSNNK